MTEIMNIDIGKATSDPEAVFDHPMDIADHVGLTRGQKIATLERWAFGVRARVDAVSEGMNNQSGSGYTDDVELLRQIEKNIAALKDELPAAT